MIVHPYLLQQRTVELPPGLGDYLRGSIGLAQFCLANGFSFHMDFRKHPLGQWLIPVDYPGLEEDYEWTELFNIAPSVFLESMNRIVGHDNVFVCTNCKLSFPEFWRPATELVKKFIVPNSDLRERIDCRKSEYGQDYEIIHIRVEDDFFDKHIPQGKYDRICKLIDSRPHAIIMTSSKLLNDRLAVFRRVSNAHPVHCGGIEKLNQLHAGILSTLVDFFLLSEARRIYQISMYDWGTGFSDRCEDLYGVPIQRCRI